MVATPLHRVSPMSFGNIDLLASWVQTAAMHIWLNLLRLAVLCAATFVVSGCGDSPELLYLYGPTKKCAAQDKEKCQLVKPYDKVELKVFPERQEVSFSQAAIGLDASNTIFKRLDNCKVVSDASFSCAGLTRSDGLFTDSTVFGSKFVSRSYWAYWFSFIKTDEGSKRSTIQWWSDNHRWLTPVIIVILILFPLGLMSN
jgi:hypothetical protein